MSANHKLTAVIRGRIATQLEWQGATALVHFDDGSIMTVRTAGAGSAPPPPSAGPGPAPAVQSLGRVRGVRQQGTTLQLDFDDGSTLTLRTAEPTSSVLVRARDQSLEYAD
jgi:hypothetical protein